MKPTNIAIDNDNELARVMDTACLGCVFADGEVRPNPDIDCSQFIQKPDGCLANGALGKFRAHGVTIDDAVDKYGSEFHVIRGRICPFHRAKLWQDEHKLTDEEAVVQVRKECVFQYDAVIYFDGTTDANSIMETIHALNECDIKPKRVFIISNSEYKPSFFMNLLQDSPLPWNAEINCEGDSNLIIGEYKDVKLRSLDIITKKCKSMYIVYFNAGFKPYPTYFNGIDSLLYNDLDRFIMLKPDDDINGLTVMRIFHKQAAGNARKTILEKAETISKEQQCQSLVRPLKDLLPQR